MQLGVIGPGDGEFVPAGLPIVLSAGGDPANTAVYVLIELVAGAGTNPGDSFTAGAGTFDVDLVVAVIGSGQTVAVPGGAAPTVLLANTGSMNVASTSADATMEAGSAGMFQGPLYLTTAATGVAAAMAVVVRPRSGNDPVVPVTSDDQSGGAPPTTETEPTTSSTTPPTTPTTPPTTMVPPTTTEPVIEEPSPTMPPDDDSGGPVQCIPQDPTQPLVGQWSGASDPRTRTHPARCRE